MNGIGKNNMKNSKITSYDKLVRDKIPEIIKGKGLIPTTHIADNAEYAKKLNKKLEEEIKEYLEDENKEELADVMEVINAILTLKGWDKDEIEEIRKSKIENRGGFEKKIILEHIEE